MFLCSREYGNMIVLPILNVIITASIYTIYIPDTLFHTVWIYIRFIYVLTRLSLEF